MKRIAEGSTNRFNGGSLSRTDQTQMNALQKLAIFFVAPIGFWGGAHAGEKLYNGIVLPDQWPPAYDRHPKQSQMLVPYLEKPPAVIPIDVGRQLLVDDFLIESTTLQRTFHTAEYHPANPVIRPDKPWEFGSGGWFAAPFSGGAWYDSSDQLFKMWYTGGYLHWSCLATSKDGIAWDKPAFDIKNGTNVVIRPIDPKATRSVDTTSVWLDHDAKNPSERFKYFGTESGHTDRWAMVYRTSPDGIHWTDALTKERIHGDRSTVFYNPFRKVWVLSERISWGGRARRYSEHADPKKLMDEGVLRDPKKGVNWIAGEMIDPRNPVEELGRKPELYNLDAAPYESLMIGAFTIWTGPSNDECGKQSLQKRNDILLGFSRDGFHWDRPDRRHFISSTWDKKNWRYGNVQSVATGCLVVGDKLYFYFSGRSKPGLGMYDTETKKTEGWDKDAATGLAILRRDGFASMDAGKRGGTLTTRPLTFKGSHLFVNLDSSEGELRAEVLDEEGKVIAPFTKENCEPVVGDQTHAAVRWQDDLSKVSGQPVRFRFHLKNGDLYAFWVSPTASGASNGYVSGGGPGFAGPTDTVGRQQ